MRRLKPPSLVSMWMLDVFCCALGCVTLLWLLKTREASFSADEASASASLVDETRGKLDESEQRSALRLAQAEKLAAELDEVNKRLALVTQERDDTANRLALMVQDRDTLAKNLALVEKDLMRSKEALALAEKTQATTEKELSVAQSKVGELDKSMAGLNAKLTASDAELAKRRGELESLDKQMAAMTKQKTDLDQLLRAQTKLREAAELTGSSAKSEMATLQDKLDEAQATIIDLQGTKAKLADKVDKLTIESENRFAGIAMTGKNVVFLLDMSGSMDRVDADTPDNTKWKTVSDTVCKVMRTLPNLEKFQVILFSKDVRYLLEAGEWIAYEKDKSIDRVRKALSEVKPAEDTNVYAGLEEAFKFRNRGLDTVYFFSDGLPTSGPGLTASQEKTLVAESERTSILARYVRRTLQTTWNPGEGGKPKVRVNAIGFFYESPDVGAFLWALARENDGSFVGMSKP